MNNNYGVICDYSLHMSTLLAWRDQPSLQDLMADFVLYALLYGTTLYCPLTIKQDYLCRS